MLLRTLAFLSLSLALVFYSCSPQNSNVIAKFGNQDIGMKEFEKAYAANEGGEQQAKKDSLSKMKNYLKLYVDFRMKLRDAYVRGFDRDSSLQSEIENYKNKIGYTYYIDHKLIEPAVKKLWEKRKTQYRISVILVSHQVHTWKTAKARAEEALDTLKKGGNWDDIVKKYSDDRYSSKDGGDIFYFTAGELPPDMENAMYTTKPGHFYPKILRTPWGYVILKVTDKRVRHPEIRISHIMISFYNKQHKIDSAGAWAKIDTVLQKLKEGEDFVKLAKEYSQDPTSRSEGGNLGYKSLREYERVKPIAEAILKLNKVGEHSGIIKSRFGYHIIKLTGIRPYPSLEEDRAKLKQLYEKTQYTADYDSLVSNLRKKYNYSLNEPVYKELVKSSDTVLVSKADSVLEDLTPSKLFSFANRDYSVGDFLKYVHTDKKIAYGKFTPALVNEIIKKESGKALLEYEAEALDTTDQAFAELMKNYRNGVYIFKLQQDEVWNKINSDSTNLYKYYLAHKSQYLTKPQVKFAEIFTHSDSLINRCYTELQNGADFDSLAAKSTERPGYKNKKGIWPLVDSSSSKLAETAYGLKNAGDYTKPFKFESGYSIVKLIKKEPVREKTYEEAKAEAAGAYQDFRSKELEKDYLNRLDKIYQPKIYYDKVEEAYKDIK